MCNMGVASRHQLAGRILIPVRRYGFNACRWWAAAFWANSLTFRRKSGGETLQVDFRWVRIKQIVSNVPMSLSIWRWMSFAVR